MQTTNRTLVTVTAPYPTSQLITPVDPATLYQAPSEFDIVIFIVHLYMFLVSLVGNCLAFVALLKKRGSIYPWFFNLIAADLLKTLTCMPYTMYILRVPEYRTALTANNPTSYFGCTFFGFLFELTLFIGLISHVGVALDRIYATYFPFKYAQNMVNTSPCWVIIITWVSVFTFCCCILLTGYLSSVVKRDHYRMQPFVPMCTMDIKEVVVSYGPTSSWTELSLMSAAFYCLVYGVPLILITMSTCLVCYKLVPPILKEHKQRKAMKTALSSITYSNNAATINATINATNDATNDASNNATIDAITISTKDSSASGRLCLGDSTVKEPSVSIKNAYSPEITAPVSPNPSLRHAQADRLVMLDQTGERIRTPKQNQLRAVVTMIMVSTAFLVCHSFNFILWTFYDLGRFDKHLTGSGFVECAIHTLQITFAYLDAPLNVMVYYNRCSFIKTNMVFMIKGLAGRVGYGRAPRSSLVTA